MEGSYGSEVPGRQFGGRTPEGGFILNQAQNSILHQLLGVSTGLGGELRKLRFLLRCGMYFHALQCKRKTALRRPAPHNIMRMFR